MELALLKTMDPYELLGITPEELDGVGSDFQKRDQFLKKARGKQTLKYHPDKVADKTPRNIDIATENMKRINAAYENLSGKTSNFADFNASASRSSSRSHDNNNSQKDNWKNWEEREAARRAAAEANLHAWNALKLIAAQQLSAIFGRNVDPGYTQWYSAEFTVEVGSIEAVEKMTTLLQDAFEKAHLRRFTAESGRKGYGTLRSTMVRLHRMDEETDRKIEIIRGLQPQIRQIIAADLLTDQKIQDRLTKAFGSYVFPAFKVDKERNFALMVGSQTGARRVARALIYALEEEHLTGKEEARVSYSEDGFVIIPMHLFDAERLAAIEAQSVYLQESVRKNRLVDDIDDAKVVSDLSSVFGLPTEKSYDYGRFNVNIGSIEGAAALAEMIAEEFRKAGFSGRVSHYKDRYDTTLTFEDFEIEANKKMELLQKLAPRIQKTIEKHKITDQRLQRRIARALNTKVLPVVTEGEDKFIIIPMPSQEGARRMAWNVARAFEKGHLYSKENASVYAGRFNSLDKNISPDVPICVIVPVKLFAAERLAAIEAQSADLREAMHRNILIDDIDDARVVSDLSSVFGLPAEKSYDYGRFNVNIGSIEGTTVLAEMIAEEFRKAGLGGRVSHNQGINETTLTFEDFEIEANKKMELLRKMTPRIKEIIATHELTDERITKKLDTIFKFPTLLPTGDGQKKTLSVYVGSRAGASNLAGAVADALHGVLKYDENITYDPSFIYIPADMRLAEKLAALYAHRKEIREAFAFSQRISDLDDNQVISKLTNTLGATVEIGYGNNKCYDIDCGSIKAARFAFKTLQTAFEERGLDPSDIRHKKTSKEKDSTQISIKNCAIDTPVKSKAVDSVAKRIKKNIEKNKLTTDVVTKRLSAVFGTPVQLEPWGTKVYAFNAGPLQASEYTVKMLKDALWANSFYCMDIGKELKFDPRTGRVFLTFPKELDEQLSVLEEKQLYIRKEIARNRDEALKILSQRTPSQNRL